MFKPDAGVDLVIDKNVHIFVVRGDDGTEEKASKEEQGQAISILASKGIRVLHTDGLTSAHVILRLPASSKKKATTGHSKAKTKEESSGAPEDADASSDAVASGGADEAGTGSVPEGGDEEEAKLATARAILKGCKKRREDVSKLTKDYIPEKEIPAGDRKAIATLVSTRVGEVAKGKVAKPAGMDADEEAEEKAVSTGTTVTNRLMRAKMVRFEQNLTSLALATRQVSDMGNVADVINRATLKDIGERLLAARRMAAAVCSAAGRKRVPRAEPPPKSSKSASTHYGTSGSTMVDPSGADESHGETPKPTSGSKASSKIVPKKKEETSFGMEALSGPGGAAGGV